MPVTNVGNDATMAKSRRRTKLLLGALCTLGLGWCGWAWWADRRYRSAMHEIESEIVAGRYAIACRNLNRLLSWKSDASGGIAYLLGSCELSRGRISAADEAWTRVLPGSAFSERAIRGRMRLLHDSGQLAAAERLISRAALDRRNDRTAVLLMLVPMLRDLGRIDEAERIVEDRWAHLNALGEGALEPAIKLLLLHIELTWTPLPVESVRASIDQAARLDAKDDRVWLGRANLAIRMENYDEAGRWLDACRQSRPDDVPVWRARLKLGIARNRIDVVHEALKHLPEAELTRAQVHRLKALLAANRGDVAIEIRELERLLAVEPADQKALERLAQLEELAMEPARAVELRRTKGEIDQLRVRYGTLYERRQPIRDALEMADLAERLGRRFEAAGFLTLAISAEPRREDLRRRLALLVPSRVPVAHPGRSLAELLADEPDGG
jgi:tetratricopeptide (TPR) repeat protein